jgi:hypothetical protein
MLGASFAHACTRMISIKKDIQRYGTHMSYVSKTSSVLYCIINNFSFYFPLIKSTFLKLTKICLSSRQIKPKIPCECKMIS